MKKHTAFTLIETLTAICVFGIGILVVLNGLGLTLRNQDNAKMQIQASFLAREGIELMFNLRDANYHKALTGNCIFYKNKNPRTIDIDKDEDDRSNFCKGYFTSGTILKVGIGTGDDYVSIQTGELKSEFSGNLKEFQIYYHTGSDNGTFVYNHEGNNEEENQFAKFARYIIIKPVKDNDFSDINQNHLIKIESHVLYQHLGRTGEKVMETFMGNYEF